jgi:tetratricopeptide (TPR) repeat protein
MGVIFYFGRRYNEAIQQFRETLELQPDWHLAHWHLGKAYFQQGARESALMHLERAAQLSANRSSALSVLGQAYAKLGRRTDALRLLDTLLGKSREEYVNPLHIARIYAGLGDRTRAFDWLEKAYPRAGASAWPLRLADPMFDEFRSEPRFRLLLKKIGLPDS